MSNTTRILVVEDNDFVRMQIVRFLADEGYDITEATDGEAALALVKEENFDLAIVDIRMEPMDGFEFMKAVEGLENDDGKKRKKLNYIMVTGDNNPDLLTDAGKWGVSAVLLKPVEKDRLVKTVERTLHIIQRAS